MNHNGSVFSSRIIEAWHYYSTMFDFLKKSESINPNTLDMVMAKQCLDLMVLEIYNLVACEGTKRIVRHENQLCRVQPGSPDFKYLQTGSHATGLIPKCRGI
ncbi:hypothetical protein H5410_053144 [Solanum commersonii]|uniref:Uncharacterized protein n=1 Tax=Solanum commersonii TaxID=4109 RepID=A0A9J5X552_SOLCO|nr:hypothetical protein H5410_053144 [Solanum commersonii]